MVVTMKNILFVAIAIVLMLVPAFSVQANTCAISTGHGLLQDVECDRVPDILDNCPGFFNPDQSDSNRNSVGDTCDRWYEETVLQQSQVQQPQIRQQPQVMQQVMQQPQVMQQRVQPVQRPVEKVVVKQVAQPKKTSQTLMEEAFPYAMVLTEETQIKLLSQHDLSAGGAGVIYPIKILNKANRIKQYSFIAFNVDAFGTYRFDPGSVVLIKPNEEKTVYLYVQADSTARLGEHTFTLRIESGDEQAQAILRATIFGDGPSLKEFSISDRLGVILLTILVLILLTALVFVLSRKKTQNVKGGRKVRY